MTLKPDPYEKWQRVGCGALLGLGFVACVLFRTKFEIVEWPWWLAAAAAVVVGRAVYAYMEGEDFWRPRW